MKKERLFWGLLFILGAVILLVSKLGYFPEVNILNLFLSACLIAIAGTSLYRKNFAGVLFPIAFICIMYKEQLGITEITPGPVLIAALFGSIGLSLIFKNEKKYKYNYNYKWDSSEFDYNTVESEGNIVIDTSFAGSIKYINTNKFERASISCAFGTMKVYFDNSTMLNESGVIKIEAAFSSVELYIPKEWAVDDKTSMAFGGVSEKNKCSINATNTVALIGDVSFSGVSIIYV